MEFEKKSLKEKQYYQYLDVIRILSCVAVFLYHLGYLPGGFLAVNIFFVLSGYLAYISMHSNRKQSIKDYYIKRLKSIYLPLVVVTFLSLFAISFLHNYSWLNLKPETFSVLFGYNNFWQLGASLNYFSRHIDSPFMHLWYISILLQFDLVFPFLYKLFETVKNNDNKESEIIVTFLVIVLSFLGFYFFSIKDGMMMAYYNTLFRIFAIFFGIFLAIIHCNNINLLPEELKKNKRPIYIFCFYSVLLLIMFIKIDAANRLFQFSMFVSSIISCRLIDYACCVNSDNKSWVTNVIKKIAALTYLIYLVQYPVIFMFQYTSMPIFVKTILIVIITILISIVINYAVSFVNYKKRDIKKIFVFMLIALLCGHGIYVFLASQDYTQEMKELEKQLDANQKLIEAKKEAYAQKLEEQRLELDSKLALIEEDINNLESLVSELPIVGIGDSVMLGAVKNLYELFPNGYFDAQVSRSTWTVNSLLQEIAANNMLGDPVVINMGANGDCSEACKDAIMATLGDRKVFWLTNTNDETLYVNDTLKEYAQKYDNLYILDWYDISLGHDDYFYADGIHLTIPGRAAYAQTVYDAVYKVYYEEYTQKTETTIKEYENTIKNKYEFFGNDLLLSSYQYIINDFIDSKFNINSSYNYNTLRDELISRYKASSLSSRIVLVLDSSFRMTEKQFKELASALKDTSIVLVYLNKDFNYNKVQTIDFNNDIIDNKDYLISDAVHLSEKGSKALGAKIIEQLRDTEE